MTSTDNHNTWSTSTGHVLSDEARLDKHFLAAKAEYEETIFTAGIQQGWHILDAGCGNGVFLPYIADLIGTEGIISAIDVAPENVNAINKYVEKHSLPCKIDARLGNVTALPYESGIFDAVWCANVTQYLTEDELSQTLSEFRRVLRPSGIAAIKEVDISIWQFLPLNPGLISRWIEAGKRQVDNTHFLGGLRGTRIPSWLRLAGFNIKKRKTFLVERWAPLTEIERAFITDNITFIASTAVAMDLSVEDKKVWVKIKESPDFILDDPDFCYREIHVLSVGISPL